MVGIWSWDTTVNKTLVIMNKVAIIAVALVKKFPEVLEDIKLSCDTPKPKAPPSDFWTLYGPRDAHVLQEAL